MKSIFKSLGTKEVSGADGALIGDRLSRFEPGFR
jgi:hypothetical protein